MRKRSAELFPTDKPIPAAAMIGRGEAVAEYSRQTGAGINLIVAGPRRTGKTSVCRAVLDRLRHRGYYVVAVDLFSLPGLAAFADAVAAGIVANRSSLNKAAVRARQAGKAALTAAQLTLATKAAVDLGIDLELVLGLGTSRGDPYAQMGDAIDLCQQIAAADGKQLVLYVDEFQKVAGPGKPYGDPDNLTELLRSKLMASERITCLFSGSVSSMLHALFDDQRRAFYQFGRIVELPRIDDDEWRAGLATRAAADDASFTPGALNLLLDRSTGHPRATMLVAQQAHDMAVATDTHTIDETLVLAGWDAALAADSASNSTSLERIADISVHAVVAARMVAAGESPYKAMRPAQARRALEALTRAGYLEEFGRGRWALTDPIFAEYLRRLP